MNSGRISRNPLPDRVTTALARSGRLYTAYGFSAQGSGLSLAFNGEPRDPLTGHDHLGNGRRTFNPVLMRFHSADTLSPFGAGGINAYAYCGGDPIGRKDPSGQQWLPAMVQGTAFLASAATGLSAINRTAAGIVRRRVALIQSLPPPSQPLSARVANTGHFLGAGTLAIAARSMSLVGGLPSAPTSPIATHAAAYLTAGAVLVTAGTGLLAKPIFTQWWRQAGMHGISRMGVLGESVYQASGVGLVVEGVTSAMVAMGRGVSRSYMHVRGWLSHYWENTARGQEIRDPAQHV
ncbi:RHS repeat-associated core domain-containing protein [Pseudomonas entomophila]|uniref:RHS repeat-associated core domain-containing protein n=1 Tax=Pseudomonas entomophila TaxID=312306 RepID=UPI0015E3F2C9|nr:RHS repeat-associated core domain-containing protein [Pseudomonas entomophila]MBA1188716.1 RHS repeat-associated core domain-containing protein [Pseudomonas entomophila]